MPATTTTDQTATDQTTFDLGALQAELTRGLYASAGVADLAVTALRDYMADTPAHVADVQSRVADVQKIVQQGVADVRNSVKDIDFKPEAVRARATKTLSESVEGLTALAKSRRTAIEERVAELRDARDAVLSNVSAAAVSYDDLVKRGESAIGRVRKAEPVVPTEPAESAEPVTAEEPSDVEASAPAKPARKPAARKPAAPKTTTAQKPAAAKTTAAKKPAAPKTAATTATKPAARKPVAETATPKTATEKTATEKSAAEKPADA